MPTAPAKRPYCNPEKYSAECIAGVAWAAGFGRDRPTLERAVAIALAESSGRVKVVNSIGCCVGLFQINVKAHTQYKTAQMQDPQQNANAAWAISNEGRNWKPWEAFTNGSYLMYIPTAKAGVTALLKRNPGLGIPDKPGSWNPFDNDPNTDNPLPDTLEGGVETATEIAQFPAKVLAWISDRNNIFRIVKVGMGVALAIVGVSIIARPYAAQVVNTTGKVVGAGKIVGKAVKK